MEVAEYIHRHGFRRWYERQLIESHAYLALAFVALILLLSGIEVLAEVLLRPPSVQHTQPP